MKMDIIKHCKYLLPCGHCDKFDRTCNQYMEIQITESTGSTVTNQIDHEHEWVCTGISTIGSSYRCIICGINKEEKV